MYVVIDDDDEQPYPVVVVEDSDSEEEQWSIESEPGSEEMSGCSIDSGVWENLYDDNEQPEPVIVESEEVVLFFIYDNNGTIIF